METQSEQNAVWSLTLATWSKLMTGESSTSSFPSGPNSKSSQTFSRSLTLKTKPFPQAPGSHDSHLRLSQVVKLCSKAIDDLGFNKTKANLIAS
ncbi:unnamed protein product [Thlaspi arvense]|uniref:Uncharacterized protein n=1 Tax=Thlaspi arvense TaxID=13288 RepID=A0AAU9T9J2_THLAR|nr:unnamed protein product [Thlaspi arvense]